MAKVFDTKVSLDLNLNEVVITVRAHQATLYQTVKIEFAQR